MLAKILIACLFLWILFTVPSAYGASFNDGLTVTNGSNNDWTTKISGTGNVLSISHTNDLQGVTFDLINLDHKSTGDAIYIVHAGGKPPGYTAPTGGDAGLNILIPYYLDGRNGSRIGSIVNDRTGMKGIYIDVQPPNSEVYGIGMHYAGKESAFFLDSQPAEFPQGNGTAFYVRHAGTGSMFSLDQSGSGATFTLNSKEAINRSFLKLSEGSEGYLRFHMTTRGEMSWGDGSAPPDIMLSRTGPKTLQTNGNLTIGGNGSFSIGGNSATFPFYVNTIKSIDQAGALRMDVRHTQATAGTVYGVVANTYDTHTSGTMNTVSGYMAQTLYSGTSGSSPAVKNMYAQYARNSLSGASPLGTINNSIVIIADSVANMASGNPNVTISNQRGIRISNQGAGSGSNGLTINNSYGLYIDSQQGAANAGYAIYSAGGQSIHAGNLRIGSTSNPTVALDVTGQINTDKVAIGNTTLGENTLVAGTSETTINTTAVTAQSKIFITPKSETEMVLFVKSKTAGQGFTVKTKNSTPSDIQFDWWVVDSKN